MFLFKAQRGRTSRRSPTEMSQSAFFPIEISPKRTRTSCICSGFKIVSAEAFVISVHDSFVSLSFVISSVVSVFSSVF